MNRVHQKDKTGDVYVETNGDGGADTQQVDALGRYVRMKGIGRATKWGYSLYEFEVYSPPQPTAIGASMVPRSHARRGMHAAGSGVYDIRGRKFPVSPAANSPAAAQGFHIIATEQGPGAPVSRIRIR
jgi:hypothetical protein